MSLLLNATTDAIIALIVLAVVLTIAFVIVFVLKRKFGKDRGMITKDEPKIVNVEVKKPFMVNEEVVFLKNLYNVLPAEFVAFPHVGVDNLVKPKGDKVLYNTILSQYIDIAIFLKATMEPVLAIDLYSPSPVAQALKQTHPNVKKALQTVGIPLMEYQLSEEYDLMELKAKVFDALPVKMLALLKDKVKNNK